jgi:hypothetical protein
MSEISVTKKVIMGARKKGSKFDFKFDPKKKVLAPPYVFIRGDVPLLSDSVYRRFPNTDRPAKKMKFNSKKAFDTAKRSILG